MSATLASRQDSREPAMTDQSAWEAVANHPIVSRAFALGWRMDELSGIASDSDGA
jgi:hypothetical protein